MFIKEEQIKGDKIHCAVLYSVKYFFKSIQSTIFPIPHCPFMYYKALTYLQFHSRLLVILNYGDFQKSGSLFKHEV